MQRIFVDFNTLTSEPVGFVKYLQDDGQGHSKHTQGLFIIVAPGRVSVGQPLETRRSDAVLRRCWYSHAGATAQVSRCAAPPAPGEPPPSGPGWHLHLASHPAHNGVDSRCASARG